VVGTRSIGVIARDLPLYDPSLSGDQDLSCWSLEYRGYRTRPYLVRSELGSMTSSVMY
jgi:hypothetical protein